MIYSEIIRKKMFLLKNKVSDNTPKYNGVLQKTEEEVFDMYITGKFETDDNFITVYANNKIYTLATNCNKNWASVSVGDTTDSGYKINQEDYDSMKKECNLEGTFHLSEDGWERVF